MGGIANLFSQRIYLDANVFVYALENLEPWNVISQTILSSVESGRIFAVTSELTLAECLVKPIKLRQEENIEIFKQVFQSSSFLSLVPVSREILIAAAEIRALSSYKLPDSIHIATARLTGCTTFVTNDRQLSTIIEPRAFFLSTFQIP